jgi:3-oxoacyl-[acyl-carrier-protein] synthase-3
MSNTKAYITNIQAYLPGEPVPNDQMESVLGQVGDKPSRARRIILKSNGIKSRYYAIDPATGEYTHTNAQLAAEAVRKLENEHFALADLTCLAAGSSYPDQAMPGHGVMVHGELDAPPCEVASAAGVCVSGMSAMKYAYLSVIAEEHPQAVAVGSDMPSAVMQAKNFEGELNEDIDALERQPELAFEKDFLRWMLSDGAGAVLIENQPRPNTINFKIDWIDVYSYANEMEACMYAGAEKKDGELISWARYDNQQRAKRSVMSVKQDVKLLNENVIHYTVEKPLAASVKKRQLSASDYSYFVPHYSSQYFRDRVYAGLEKIDFVIPKEKWFTNLPQKGNTGAASIYIMLEELRRTQPLEQGQKILCYIPESGRFSSCFMQLTVITDASDE